MRPRELIALTLALSAPAESPLPFRLGAAILLLHLGGLLLVARLAHWPPAVALLCLLGLLALATGRTGYGLRFTYPTSPLCFCPSPWLHCGSRSR